MASGGAGQTILIIGGVAVGGYLLLKVLASKSTTTAASSPLTALEQQLQALLKQSQSKSGSSPGSTSGGPSGSLKNTAVGSGTGLLAQLASIVGIGNSETSLLSTFSDNTTSLLADNPLTGFSWAGFDNTSQSGLPSTSSPTDTLIPYGSVTAFVDQLPTFSASTWDGNINAAGATQDFSTSQEFQNAFAGDYGAAGSSDLSSFYGG
jgi:hypothetical protein